MYTQDELLSLSLKRASSLLKNREISSFELTQAYIDNIKTKDGEIGAYITVCAERALKAANDADKKIKEGTVSNLTGIPYALKDNICTKGIRTTCASKMLEDFVPPYDATVSELLNREDAVLLGKTNLDEFSMGSTCENSALKTTVNPLDTRRVPGGSSGGSAAAVASGQALFALGSDTGGSVRVPASFCGLVGLMPTYGAVSRNGLIAFASSLDRIGPMTKSVIDNALVFSSLCLKDERDATSIGIDERNMLDGIDGGVCGMHLAIPREMLADDISSEVKEAITRTAAIYEKLGASVDIVSMPSVEHALGAYYVISSAEASSNLARFDGVRFGYSTMSAKTPEEFYTLNRSYGFGDEVKRRVMLGTFVLSEGYHDSYYKNALMAKERVKEDFDGLFDRYDALLSPVYPSLPPMLKSADEDPGRVYTSDSLTIPASIAGIPAITLPCANSEGMPIGLQIMGREFSEKMLYRIAYSLERELNGGKQ